MVEARPAGAPRVAAQQPLTRAALEKLNLVAADLSAVDDAATDEERAQQQVSGYLAELERHPDQRRAGRLHYECARLLEFPLGDLAQAVEHYRQAYLLIPHHVPTIRGARRTLTMKGDLSAALPLLDAEFGHTGDAQEKALLLYEKGLLLERIGNKRAAQAAFAQASDLEKGNYTFLAAARVSEFQAEAWTELEHVDERAAQMIRTDARQRAALLSERARLVEVRRHDVALAAELYGSALALDAQAPGALSALRHLHYGARRWQDLVAVLRTEAELATDRGVKAQAYYRAGVILVERLGDLEGGLKSLEQAAAQTPEDSSILERLGHGYELAQRYDGLTSVLQRLVQQTRDVGSRVAYLHRMGRICEAHLDQEVTAIGWYEHALRLDAAHLPTIHALTGLYTRRQAWAPLATMLLNEAEAVDDNPRRAAAHARIARLQEDQLGNLDEAVAHHTRALGLLPGYPPSFKALARLHSRAGRYRELADLYEQAVEEAADNETRIVYLFKIGRLQEDSLGAPERAFRAYQRVLELEPRHLGALHALQRAAERSRIWPELVEALRREAQQTDDARQRAAILHRAAEVLDQELGDTEGALEQYRRIIELLPTYLPALHGLGELQLRAGRWEELLDTYRRELKAVPRGPAAATLLVKMADVSAEQLGQTDEALALYQEAVAIDFGNIPARRGLDSALAVRSAWKELAELLEREAGVLEQIPAKASGYCRLAEIYEHRLDEEPRALAAYEQALAADPTFRPALDGRSRLLEQARKWSKLADVLEEETKLVADPVAAIAAKVHEAEIRRDELGQRERAVACFEEVLERDGRHVGSLLALESLHAATGDWASLARVLALQAQVLSEAVARVAALHRLASLQEEHGLGEVEERKQTLFSVLQLAPDDRLALTMLERLSIQVGDRQLLGHVDSRLGAKASEAGMSSAHSTRLGEALESAGDPAALRAYRAALARDSENLAAARALSRLAQRSGEPELLDEAATWEARVTGDQQIAARLLVKAASVQVQRGDAAAAAALLERALTLAPDLDLAADRLRELLLASGEVLRLVEHLVEAGEKSKDLERRARRLIMVAELRAEQLGDLPGGLAALRRIASELPGHVPTLLKQAELFGRDGQWKNAAECLNQVVARSKEREVLVLANLKLARIMAERLGDEKGALGALRSVLGADENHPEALEAMLEIQLGRGDHEAAAATAQRLVAVVSEPHARGRARSLQARVERARGNVGEAFAAAEEAVALCGPGGGAADELKALLPALRRSGDASGWQRYVRALGQFLEQRDLAATVRAQAHLEAGRVLAEHLQDRNAAIGMLERGLRDDDTSLDLSVELVSCLREAGRHERALTQLRRMLELDVTRAQTWRDIVDALNAMHRSEAARIAMAPLVAMGMANDLERATVGARGSRFGAIQPRAFGTAELDLVDVHRGRDAVAPALAAVAEALSRLHPADLTRHGLSSRDRIGSRSGHPLRAVADRVGQIFGVEDFNFYVQSVRAGVVTVELTDPVSLVAPAFLATVTESQQVFLIGRALALVARQVHPIDALAPPELELVLRAATLHLLPPAASEDPFIQDYAKRLQKALSRRARRSLEEAGSAYVSAAGSTDFAAWVKSMRIGAARAGALLADDLPGSIALVRRLEGDLAGVQGEALAFGIQEMNDLVRFWVSEEALSLREVLGLA